MNSLKILHVVKKYPDAMGGDAVVVASLQTQQELAGHQVAILTSSCPEIKDGPHIYKFGLRDTPAALDHITLKRLVSLLGLFWKAFSVLRRERPDVIHTHSIDMAFFVSFAARFFKIPVVHTFHIVTFYDENQSAFRRKSELWLTKASNLAAITAPNAYDVAALKRAGFVQSLLLPNGVDLEFWRADPEAVKSQPFTFVSVGRLEAQKGYEYLIKAAALLKKTFEPGFRVIIVGLGGQQVQLQALVQSQDVADVVAFAGPKTPAEIRALLSAAGAAAFASLYETTPLTLLEAWAVGVPVIITPVGILHGASSDTGRVYLVPPKDERSLMTAMQRCMTDEVLRTKIAAAGHKEAQKYAWPGIAEVAETLYRSVL